MAIVVADQKSIRRSVAAVAASCRNCWSLRSSSMVRYRPLSRYRTDSWLTA